MGTPDETIVEIAPPQRERVLPRHTPEDGPLPFSIMAIPGAQDAVCENITSCCKQDTQASAKIPGPGEEVGQLLGEHLLSSEGMSLWRMSPCGRLGPVFQAPLCRLDGILGRA